MWNQLNKLSELLCWSTKIRQITQDINCPTLFSLFTPAAMLNFGLSKSYPLFVFIMAINFAGAITSFLVGSWLIFTSQFFYSSSVAAEAIKKHADVEFSARELVSVDFACIMLLVVGIFAILVGLVFTMNGCDILILLNDWKKKSCIDSYRGVVKSEMKRSAKTEDAPNRFH